MSAKTKLVFLVLSFAWLVATSGCNADAAKAKAASSQPVRLEGERIVVSADSKILGRLVVTEAQASSKDGRQGLKTVGQIIAVANPTGDLSGSRVSWVELDPEITASLGIKLDGGSAGTAYGVTSIASSYRNKIKTGQGIEIARYGFQKDVVPGIIVAIRASTSTDRIEVAFRTTQGRDFLPGTNSEVTFPLLQAEPVKLPTTALLHEGMDEYVLVEVAPCEFAIRPVSIGNELSSDEVMIISGIVPGDRVVARGAILLNPLVKAYLRQKRGRNHAS